MMRFLPSFAAVQFMKQGMSPTQACEKAVEPIAKYYPAAEGALICLNAKGEFGGGDTILTTFKSIARPLGLVNLSLSPYNPVWKKSPIYKLSE